MNLQKSAEPQIGILRVTRSTSGKSDLSRELLFIFSTRFYPSRLNRTHGGRAKNADQTDLLQVTLHADELGTRSI